MTVSIRVVSDSRGSLASSIRPISHPRRIGISRVSSRSNVMAVTDVIGRPWIFAFPRNGPVKKMANQKTAGTFSLSQNQNRLCRSRTSIVGFWSVTTSAST
ncbi:unnamed protein product [Ectocarpus sp. 8 AP-2014]